MQADGAYECTLQITAFGFASFAHGLNLPAVGNIERLRATHVPGVFHRAWQTSPLPVRAVRADCGPDIGELAPFALDELRFAMWRSLAVAIEARDDRAVDDAILLLTSVRVRFELLPSEDDYERTKWLVLAKDKQLQDNVDLRGIRRSLAVLHVQDMLERRGGTGKVTAKVVAEWRCRGWAFHGIHRSRAASI
jgi:hypothetical protein